MCICSLPKTGYGIPFLIIDVERPWAQCIVCKFESLNVSMSHHVRMCRCTYVCICVCVNTLIIHALMSPQRNIGFQKLYKLLTIGYLRHSSHVLIYIFHYVIILAILSGDTKYNLIIALVLYIAWATKRFLMIMFVATDGIYETHNEGWHRY